MINSYKITAILALLFYAPLFVFGQNDGIRGYASFEFLGIDSGLEGKSYTTGGGGLIINNNIVFGGYVGTFTEPFRWDLFTQISNPNQPTEVLTTNVNATNSTISSFDVGARIGFNIAPSKSFQSTISVKIAYSTINYSESYVDTLAFEIYDEILPIAAINIIHNNFNFSPQLDFQFKIGSAFKLSLIVGHKFHSTKIVNRNVFPDNENLLVDKNLFGGAYAGIGFSFGNL